MLGLAHRFAFARLQASARRTQLSLTSVFRIAARVYSVRKSSSALVRLGDELAAWQGRVQRVAAGDPWRQHTPQLTAVQVPGDQVYRLTSDAAAIHAGPDQGVGMVDQHGRLQRNLDLAIVLGRFVRRQVMCLLAACLMRRQR